MNALSKNYQCNRCERRHENVDCAFKMSISRENYCD